MQPVIGILCSNMVIGTEPFIGDIKCDISIDYIEAIERAGGIPLLIPMTKNKEVMMRYEMTCDGFLFPGGIDIHPFLYGKDFHRGLNKVFYDLDLFQSEMMRFILEVNKPLLGICRGAQLLNVVAGGTLFQDLDEIPTNYKHYMQGEKTTPAHKIQIEQNTFLGKILGKTVSVNSFHHQCIKDLGSNIHVLAKSPDSAACIFI